MSDPDESSPEEFAEAIGRAIIAWHAVEALAANLFSSLLLSPGMGGVAVFYHIKNFKTRLEMMNIAARFLFLGSKNKKLLAKWRTLSRQILTSITLRNRIAHSELSEATTETSWKFWLGPPILDWSQLDPDKMDRWAQRQSARVLTYSDIKDAWIDFEKLAGEISTFKREVDSLRETLSERLSEPLMIPNARVLGSGHLVLTAHEPLHPRRKKPTKQ